MAHVMQLVSSYSSFSSSCGAIQAAQPRLSGCTASPSAFAAVFGHGVAGSARISLKKGGQRLLLPRDTDVGLMKRSGGRKQAAGAMVVRAVVRATDTTGVVKEVRTEVKGIYYNLTLSVPVSSDVAKWYQTPGQYVNLIPAKSTQPNSASFFISSPKRLVAGSEQLHLEFLIQDVASSVANELINSQPGDSVLISTNTFSHGFNVEKLQGAEYVLMFAGGYGLGPIRAFIETGFQANQRRDAILYTMYAPNQEPYMHKHPIWKQSGVMINCFENIIKDIDPAKTVVLMVASEDEQERLMTYFKGKGVPDDQILTLFAGIPTTAKAYSSKVPGEHNFLHMGELHVPFALKI